MDIILQTLALVRHYERISVVGSIRFGHSTPVLAEAQLPTRLLLQPDNLSVPLVAQLAPSQQDRRQ